MIQLLVLQILVLAAPSFATTTLTPAQVNELSKKAKAISTEQWQKIAGDKVSQRYEILKGDTLSSISARLFGDTKYWPKIWAINNRSFPNPHWIKPGRSLVFQIGGSTSLPQIQLEDKIQTYSSGSDRPGPTFDERTPKPATEWKRLARQPWEKTNLELPPGADKDGFDHRNYVNRRRNVGIELDSMLACEPIETVGKILGSREETMNFSLTDQIVIEPGTIPLEVDQEYHITAEPDVINNEEKDQDEKDSRQALVYHLNGRVLILGVHEGTYLGKITAIKGRTSRENILVPRQAKVKRGVPIPGPAPVEGKVLFDRTQSTFMTAQDKWVYIDRGTDDGVAPGMVFRVFQYKDPLDQRKLTESNMLVQGDVQILQSCGKFSQGIVLWSRGPIQDRTPAILLTDVSEIKTRYYLNGELTPGTLRPDATEGLDPLEPKELPPEYPNDSGTGEEKDWLDELDTAEEMDAETEKILQQLEEHKEGDESGTQTPTDLPPPQPQTEGSGTNLPAPPTEDPAVLSAPEPTPTALPTAPTSEDAVVPDLPPPPSI